MVVKSRGYGKTWLTALCCIVMGVLYPGSLIAVVSGTAEQATLIVKKIQDYFIRNPEIMREIQCDGHRPVQLSRNKGICTLKNGSKIESYSVGTMRGNRAKIMVIDESPEVKADDLDAVIGPVRNTKRDICHQRGIAGYSQQNDFHHFRVSEEQLLLRHVCKRTAGFRQGQHGQLCLRAGLPQRGARGHYRHGVLPKGTAQDARGEIRDGIRERFRGRGIRKYVSL